jgi:hypothetical protein
MTLPQWSPSRACWKSELWAMRPTALRSVPYLDLALRMQRLSRVDGPLYAI